MEREVDIEQISDGKRYSSNDLVKLECEECGGKNIQVLAWVDANTNKYKDEGPSLGLTKNWCDDCEDHTPLIKEDEYSDKEDE